MAATQDSRTYEKMARHELIEVLIRNTYERDCLLEALRTIALPGPEVDRRAIALGYLGIMRPGDPLLSGAD